MLRQNSLLSLTAGLAGALFLALSGWTVSATMIGKAQEQTKTLEDFRQWRSSYEALIPVQLQWDKSFHPASEVRDMLSLHALLNSALSTNMDRLVVETLDRVKVGELELGLSRVCLASAGEPGLNFEGESFSVLVAELKKMAQRHDIQMGQIKLFDYKSKPTALVTGFCLLLRD